MVRRARDTTVANGLILVAPLPLYVGAEGTGGLRHSRGGAGRVDRGTHGSSNAVAYTGRLQATGLWMTITFILQSAAFFLVGLEMPVLDALPSDQIATLTVAIPVVFVTLVMIRFAFVFPDGPCQRAVVGEPGLAGGGMGWNPRPDLGSWPRSPCRLPQMPATGFPVPGTGDQHHVRGGHHLLAAGTEHRLAGPGGTSAEGRRRPLNAGSTRHWPVRPLEPARGDRTGVRTQGRTATGIGARSASSTGPATAGARFDQFETRSGCTPPDGRTRTRVEMMRSEQEELLRLRDRKACPTRSSGGCSMRST